MPLRAVILYGTGDPTANTTAPTGALAGSGWQYEGAFNGLGGTVIATNYFITAKHIGGSVGNIFVFNGVNYTTDAAFPDPSSDLQIWRVAGNFPTHAPVFSSAPGSEVNLGLVVIGRGRQRGSAVTVGDDSHLGGWLWGSFDDVQRWGTNVVGSIFIDSTYGDLLRAPFNSDAGPNEAHLAPGDSGGAVFVLNPATNVWELAGINLAADGPFSASQTGANSFDAAMFDTTGLFVPGAVGGWVSAPNPSAFYATEIAVHRGFIEATVMGLSSVVSRKMHGNTAFDVHLPESGPPGIECRSGGMTNNYQLVFTFANDVSVTNAIISSGAGSVSTVAVQGNLVTVNLMGVMNAQTITLTLKNVNDGINISDVEAKMSVLVADTNADRSVDSADITNTKSQSGSAVTESNFRKDINADGFLDSADISLVKSKSGTGLPSTSVTLSAPVGSTSLRTFPLPPTKPRPSAILPRKKSGEQRR
ncbi:MAG: hypothetical protein DME57_07525 [Verrucomicrobia bacterium]|nr:MAG: hypothetical protein DME57_07525 [Verrucomicrobiota bacterium]